MSEVAANGKGFTDSADDQSISHLVLVIRSLRGCRNERGPAGCFRAERPWGITVDRHPNDCSAGAQAQIPLRLTIVIDIAATPALLLSGYLPEDDSRKPLAAHDQKRDQLGFTQGTPERAKCRLERAREATPRGASPATAD
jgi:hypothetical protein